MKFSPKSTLCINSVLLTLFMATISYVPAQIDENGTIKHPPPRIKIQKIIKVVKVPEIRFQKISGVTITTVQPNADITLKSAASGKKYKQIKKTDSFGVLNLENVPPGKYALTVSLDGYVTEESDVEVIPQRLVTIPVNLAPITHDIFIKTNVKNGEVRYARIQKKAGNSAKDIGGYCMVPIQNGTAAVLRMQEGNYSLEVHPDDVEYKTVSREIAISEEVLSKTENASGRNEILINLARTTSTEDFLANWLPNEWKLPANWKIDNKRMQISGAGVALLQNERYNYYKDFELKTNVRSLDNKSVGFVLRAVDDRNYYLIQITGSAADEPYFLTGYIVKNGKVAEVLVPANIKAYAQSFGDRKYFNLTIEAKGNIFKMRLEDIETGRSFIIGIIEDQNNTFPIGAVGIGTKDASRFDVNLFNINYK
ncbi:MAG: carboxypeptidase-like regulatory domain-containing protein [Pyrinomonadaceae bacterium]